MQPCSWLQTIERGLSQALNGYSLIATRGLVTLPVDTGIPFRSVIGLLGQALLGSEASVNGTTAYTGIRLTGTADLLVHHIHAFTIHVTALILVKGVAMALVKGVAMALVEVGPVKCLRGTMCT